MQKLHSQFAKADYINKIVDYFYIVLSYYFLLQQQR